MSRLYGIETAKVLYGNYIDLDGWDSLTVEQYAKLGILVHPLTVTHRYARVFNHIIGMKKIEALNMLKSGNFLPEMAALTEAEKQEVTKAVNREFAAMLMAFKNRLSYEDAFKQIYPYYTPFPSEIILISRRINGVTTAISQEYEDFIIGVAQDKPEFHDYRQKFAKEIKMYVSYLKLVQGQ